MRKRTALYCLMMALALGLSAAMNQPIGGTKFGVFRM